MAEDKHDLNCVSHTLGIEARRIREALGLEAVEIVAVVFNEETRGEDLSSMVANGAGCFHTRFGAVCEWTEIKRARHAEHGRRTAYEPPKDEDDV